MRAQVHLIGKATQGDAFGGFSGRAVRYKRLMPGERDQVAKDAAREVGKDATMMDVRFAEIKLGIKSMLTHVTKDPVKDMMSPDAKWEAVDLEKLGFVNSPLHYDKLFTAKDDTLLARIYTSDHEASAQEVEAIMGKAVPLTED